jgi:hypothetical protein
VSRYIRYYCEPVEGINRANVEEAKDGTYCANVADSVLLHTLLELIFLFCDLTSFVFLLKLASVRCVASQPREYGSIEDERSAIAGEPNHVESHSGTPSIRT